MPIATVIPAPASVSRAAVWPRSLRALLLLVSLNSVQAQAEETAMISQSALVARIEQKDDALLILDVRTREEFAAGHVPGALNIPYTELPARIAELPSVADKDVVVYCTTGVRAERAATRFRENGFTRLLHLEGDMKKWVENGLALEK
jgi:phage shock protein E